MTLEEDLRALERRLLDEGAGGRWLAEVDAIRKLVASGASEDAIKLAVARLLPLTIEGTALAVVSDAYDVGRSSALELVNVPRRRERSLAEAVPTNAARAPLIGVDALLVDALAASRALMIGGAEQSAYLAPVFGAANSLASRVTSSVVAGGNQGVRRAASAAGVPTVWIAETNACVHCLAYSGRVVQSGERFPGGLTYGAKSYFPEDVATPPRHPHCRCFLEPLRDQSYADALRREADRSVLRGFSLESESMSVRVGAAKKLLDEGVTAPKSVIAYAEAAVKRGTFSTRGR